MPNDFDAMTEAFTVGVRRALHWREAYFGAAYATRVKAAIADLKATIAEAEAHPEIGPVEAEKRI